MTWGENIWIRIRTGGVSVAAVAAVATVVAVATVAAAGTIAASGVAGGAAAPGQQGFGAAARVAVGQAAAALAHGSGISHPAPGR